MFGKEKLGVTLACGATLLCTFWFVSTLPSKEYLSVSHSSSSLSTDDNSPTEMFNEVSMVRTTAFRNEARVFFPRLQSGSGVLKTRPRSRWSLQVLVVLVDAKIADECEARTVAAVL